MLLMVAAILGRRLLLRPKMAPNLEKTNITKNIYWLFGLGKYFLNIDSMLRLDSTEIGPPFTGRETRFDIVEQVPWDGELPNHLRK